MVVLPRRGASLPAWRPDILWRRCAVRARLRRSFSTRLKLVFAVVLVLSGSLPAFTGWAQDSGAATFTVASANGNVVIKRANGSSEVARLGTQLYANDQLASVGRSEAMLN